MVKLLKLKYHSTLLYETDVRLYQYLIVLFKIAEAEENLGESEVREPHSAKSWFYIRIGDKVGDIDYVTLAYFFFFTFNF